MLSGSRELRREQEAPLSIEDHPSARAARLHALTVSAGAAKLTADELRALCLSLGADDVGFVSIEEPLIAQERAQIEYAFPGVKSLIAICCRMSMENVRSPLRSIANQTFHATGHHVDDVCRSIVLALSDKGVRACNPSMAFPMEIANIPDKQPWLISLKLVAEAGGLGVRGIHRSVIHPKFGSFVLLGVVLVDREIEGLSKKLDYNPCVGCKLCVAACPVGAIQPDGHFDVSACMTHNYREFLGGFSDWVETVVDSKSVTGYRDRMEDGETLSVWQSLAFGPNYKAAYCLSVCPAGEDVLGPFLAGKAEHVRTVVKPLQQKEEPLYVVKGSDAESFASERYPHKRLRYVHNGARPTSVANFLSAITWTFQRGQSKGLNATYHFTFTGAERTQATVVIADRKIDVRPGHHGTADARITADSRNWVKFLRGERSLPRLLLTRKLRLSPLPQAAKLLAAFGRCFPA
ncbi:MAG: SCP2 sterol-binding domain-containing protein [Phycisphaerales bacterium]